MTAPTRTTFTPGEEVTNRHPVRGFFWGLLMGLGLALVAVITKVVSLSLSTMIILVVAGIVLGVVWGLYGPSKAPKGPPPAQRTVVAPQATRFDDFEPAPSTGHAETEGEIDGEAGQRDD